MVNNAATSRENSMRTVVVLCGDLADLGAGLNLEELRSSLEASFPGIAVEVVPDICGHPARLVPVVTGRVADRAVLGFCSGKYAQVELQAQARQAGLDPFGMEVLPLGTLCAKVHAHPEATQKAKTLLAAAVAKARAFQGSGPEHAKIHFLPLDEKVTRRSLFSVPPIGYRPLPSIRGERCAVESGCQLCVKACPRDALRRKGEHLCLDKLRCEGCGVCLAACPGEAIDFPGWSLSQFEAQLAALLDSAMLSPEPSGLLLTCQGAFGKLEELAQRGMSYSPQWLPVAIPCLGMVTPTWILQALARGARVVALLSCSTDCPFGQEQVIGGRVNFCRRLLRLLGLAPDHVRLLSASHLEDLFQALQQDLPRKESSHQGRLGDRLRLGTPDAAFQAIQCLVDTGASSPTVALEHPHSPFGVLELRGEGCTGCLACVEACPTGALVSERGADGVAMTYVASSCTGCEMCVDICPETAAKVLRVRRTTDLVTLSRGMVVLHNHQLATCEGCGASIASQALLRRIEASVEERDEALHAALTRYCPSCRLSFAVGAISSRAQDGAGMRSTRKGLGCPQPQGRLD